MTCGGLDIGCGSGLEQEPCSLVKFSEDQMVKAVLYSNHDHIPSELLDVVAPILQKIRQNTEDAG